MEPTGAPDLDLAALFLAALAKALPQLMQQVRFGAAAECFDPEYWERPKPRSDHLHLREGKSASKAINQLLEYSEMRKDVEGAEHAKLDCVEIIEVARWIAQRQVIGVEAFDALYSGRPFQLAAPGSTGVTGLLLGERIGEEGDGDRDYFDTGGQMTGTMLISSDDEGEGIVSLATHLAELPVGSRVMWRNFDPRVPRYDDFKNENTLKIGADLYAAHPLGIFTLAEMSQKVAKGHYEDMVEFVEQTTESLAKARQKLKAAKETVARNEKAKAAEGDGSGPEDDGGEPDPAVLKVERLAARIQSLQADLARYEGIDSLAAYVTRFIRVVETETFVNPCATASVS